MFSIALCESGVVEKATHYNSNHTHDMGVFQLNSAHSKEFKQMGINPYNYLDNINYALFLAKTEGLKHWASSASCWKPKSRSLAIYDG